MQKGRYSKYIRPISIFTDLFLIIVLIPFFYKGLNINFIFFGIYLAFIWIIISFFSRFYEVYRFTTPVEILTKIAKQSVIFILLIIAYFPFNKEFVFSGKAIALYSISLFSVIILIKSLFFYYLKKYRIVTGNNFRNAIIIGYTNEALDLKKIFDERPDYGYRFKGFFSDKKVNENIEGKIASIKTYCIENKIDEIYCSLNEISDEKLKDLVEFGDNNSIVVKFIPDSKAIFSKNLKIDYYELFPVLSLQKTALHDPLIKNFKRGFDFIFSLFVIILVLSWLTPLMALLIKLESRGPVFLNKADQD